MYFYEIPFVIAEIGCEKFELDRTRIQRGSIWTRNFDGKVKNIDCFTARTFSDGDTTENLIVCIRLAPAADIFHCVWTRKPKNPLRPGEEISSTDPRVSSRTRIIIIQQGYGYRACVALRHRRNPKATARRTSVYHPGNRIQFRYVKHYIILSYLVGVDYNRTANLPPVYTRRRPSSPSYTPKLCDTLG